MLQWGHGLITVVKTESDVLMIREEQLQWGHGLITVVKWPLLFKYLRERLASMGPRSDNRG